MTPSRLAVAFTCSMALLMTAGCPDVYRPEAGTGKDAGADGRDANNGEGHGLDLPDRGPDANNGEGHGLDLPDRGPDLPAGDLPTGDMPAKDMPPKDMPPKDMPAKDMPPKDMPPKDMPPKDAGADATLTKIGCKTAKHCTTDKWCWDNPFPIGNRIHAIWGSGAKDIFFVGALGMIRRHDGVKWTTERPVKEDLYGVWGAGPSDVWAVGAKGTVRRFDGVYWKIQGASTTKDLYGVWGSGPSDVWVVGQDNTVMRYDGKKWSVSAGPCKTGKDKDLRGVWASGPSDAWVAGCGGVASQWDGTKWTPRHQAAADLYAVWGNSSTDLYFAGVGGTVLYRNNKKQWILQSKPAGFNEALRGVWGTKTRTWAVGTSAAVLERSGSTWVKVATPGKGGILASNLLYAVWGTCASNVYAAGSGGVVLRYDGKKWYGLVSGATPDLNDVWGNGNKDVLAVGSGGHVLRYDGVQWAVLNTPTTKDLNAVWGAGSSTRYVVGDDKTVLRWDAKAVKWDMLTAPTSKQLVDLHGVWGSSTTDVYVAYRWGDLLRFNGAAWSHDSTMLSGPSGVARRVWGTSATDIYVVGQTIISPAHSGVGAHKAGGGWTKLAKSLNNLGTKGWMYDVWVASNGYAFIASATGKVFRCLGTGTNSCVEWQPTKNALYGIWGRGSLDVYAVGDRGTIVHYYQGSWKAEASGTVHDLRGVFGDAKEVLAVGKDGTILRKCP